MRQSKTRCFVLLILVFILWSTARSQILPGIKTRNESKIGPAYNIIKNYTANPGKKVKASNGESEFKLNYITLKNKTSDKFDPKFLTELLNERNDTETAIKKVENQKLEEATIRKVSKSEKFRGSNVQMSNGIKQENEPNDDERKSSMSLEYDENGDLIKSRVIIKPPILIDQSSFVGEGNESSASSNEKDGALHRISKSKTQYSRSVRAVDLRKINCPYPKHKNSRLDCNETESTTTCKQTCVFGYTTSQGRKRVQKCPVATGFWSPSRRFSDCKPFVDCTIGLKPGGHKLCIRYNKPNKSPKCYIVCDKYSNNEKVKGRWYTCDIHGNWKPKLPRCAIQGTRLRLVDRPRDL